MRRILIGAALLAAIVAPADAQDIMEQRRARALEFAECPAQLWGWVGFLRERGGYHQDDIEGLKACAREAHLEAVLLVPPGVWVDELTESSRTAWRTKLLAGDIPDMPQRISRCLQMVEQAGR